MSRADIGFYASDKLDGERNMTWASDVRGMFIHAVLLSVLVLAWLYIPA